MNAIGSRSSKFYFGGAARNSGGALARFVNHHAHADQASAALRADHPALTTGNSQFPSRVYGVQDVPRLLISGRNSAKIGKTVVKGPWAGMAIYTLTLEERATCPRSCHVWRECYGNAMPMARRLRHGPELVERLGFELRQKAFEHPRGFVVRLHVLGDFYASEYVDAWGAWLRDVPQLHVFGYSARMPETEIGARLDGLNVSYPDRWVIRFSVPTETNPGPFEATTIWRQPESHIVPEGQVCPVSLGKTDCCGTCGLCWHPEMKGKRIVFVGHGMNRRGNAVEAREAKLSTPEHAPRPVGRPRKRAEVPAHEKGPSMNITITITDRIEIAPDARFAVNDFLEAVRLALSGGAAPQPAAESLPVEPVGPLRSLERLRALRYAVSQNLTLERCAAIVNQWPGAPMPQHEVAAWMIELRDSAPPPAPSDSSRPKWAPPLWSDERDAVIRECVPAGVSSADLLAKVNSLPGEKVTSTAHLAGRAAFLDVRRPANWDSVKQRISTAVPATGGADAARESATYTPARAAIIKRDWPLGVAVDVVMARCNALPGKPITSTTRLGIEANRLGVRRPDGFNPQKALRPAVDEESAPALDQVAAPAAVAKRQPELTCIDCGSPRSAGSAERCRGCYEAVSRQQRATAPAPFDPALVAPAVASPPLLGVQAPQQVTFAHQTKPAAPSPRLVTPQPKPDAAAPLPVRTPEREKRMRDGIARHETFGQLVSAVNCFPGARVTAAELQAWVSELKPESAGPRAAGVLRTDARRRVLEAAFKTGDCPEHITTKLNALEGPKFDAKSVQNWIADLKLTRIVEAPTAGLRTIDYNAAVTWAIREGVTFPSCDDKDVHRAINQAREEAGLPLWKIVDPRGKKMAIPHKALAA